MSTTCSNPSPATRRLTSRNLKASRNCAVGSAATDRFGCVPVIPEKNTNSPVSRTRDSSRTPGSSLSASWCSPDHSWKYEFQFTLAHFNFASTTLRLPCVDQFEYLPKVLSLIREIVDVAVDNLDEQNRLADG